jgi:hypothetical protein
MCLTASQALASKEQHPVPAARSRTDRWRELLSQILQRGGGIEFSIAEPDQEGHVRGRIVWRVRLLGLTEHDLICEKPAAFGQSITLAPKLEVVGSFSVGQNRWIFRTTTLAPGVRPPGVAASAEFMRLAMPEKVERCPRREFVRVPVASLELPEVECWPLLDPTTVVAAEVANAAVIHDLDRGIAAPESVVLPEVGPRFMARLMNVGGGGVGLQVSRGEATAADRSRLVWMRVPLSPYVPAPLGITGRVVHTHRDSEQNLYLGVAFDFAFNASHKEFASQQIARFVAGAQAQQREAA